MKNVDRVFEDAFAHYATPVPAGLWERVESGIPPATGYKTSLRWAAVLVPVMVAAGIWAMLPDNTDVIAVKHAAPAPVPSVDVIKTPDPQPIAVNAQRNKPTASMKQAPQKASHEIQSPETAVVEEIFLTEEITIEPVALDSEPAATEQTPVKPMVIVYTLETVAVPAPEKETSLERVVEFARAVKHSDPIGDIRGLKDEVFAFDFRKKQTKKN
jgi:hypothetical protein